jgi:hypothetical protein
MCTEPVRIDGGVNWSRVDDNAVEVRRVGVEQEEGDQRAATHSAHIYYHAAQCAPVFGSGSFYHQARIIRKILITTAFWLLFDFLSSKNDVNVPSKSTVRSRRLLKKISFC